MLRKDRFDKGLWSQGGVCSLTRHDIDQPSLRVLEGVHECPTCGLFQKTPPIKPGYFLQCSRCGEMLHRRRKTSLIVGPLVFCVASLALYFVLLVSPLMTLNVYGRENTVSLLSGPLELAAEGFGEIGLLVGIATMIMPGIVLILMACILYGSSKEEMPVWVRPFLRWYERLRPWSMVEVYVIGMLVAYSKLVDLAVVTLQPGVFLLGGLMLMMAAMDSAFDVEMIWQHRSIEPRAGLGCYDVEKHEPLYVGGMLSCSACRMVFVADDTVEDEADMGDCPRCGYILRRRKRNSGRAALSFLVAALIFYVPANLFPVMALVKVGSGQPSTIISGVIELWQANLYFLSLLVLFASITVPVLKIISLFLMLWCQYVGRMTEKHLRRMSQAYRMVVFIGRWSMIDVFMISILSAVVRFGFMANVTAQLGVVFFATVVVLTIFAADLYDPRRMWDSSGYNKEHLELDKGIVEAEMPSIVHEVETREA